MALPVEVVMVTVTGTFYKPDGTRAGGTVTFTIPQNLLDPTGDAIIAPGPLSAPLDANGHFSLSIPATNSPNITPTGWTYAVRVALTGFDVWTFNLAVPYTSPGSPPTLDLADATQVGAASGSAQPVDGGNAATAGTTILLRGDTAAHWASSNPVLRARELVAETDTGKLKLGDGTTAYTALGYVAGGSGGASTSALGVVVKSGGTWPPRPSGYGAVEWRGPQPAPPSGGTGMAPQDNWSERAVT